jgi:hypothetical protein
VTELEGSPFRPDAYAKVALARSRATLPPLARPIAFPILWSLVAVVFAAGALAWCTKVPAFVSGIAIAIEPGDVGNSERMLVVDGRRLVVDERATVVDARKLVVLMPPECCTTWRTGQRISVRVRDAREWLDAVLMEADDATSGPRAIEERFQLRGAAAAALDRPRAVAVAVLAPEAREPSPPLEPGTILDARIEHGRRRALTLLPGLDRFAEEGP